MQLYATRTTALYIANYNEIQLAAAAAMSAAHLGQAVDFNPQMVFANLRAPIPCRFRIAWWAKAGICHAVWERGCSQRGSVRHGTSVGFRFRRAVTGGWATGFRVRVLWIRASVSQNAPDQRLWLVGARWIPGPQFSQIFREAGGNLGRGPRVRFGARRQ